MKHIRTESSFSTNQQVRTNAGMTDIRRASDVKDISIALYDVDYAILWHIEQVITPTVVDISSGSPIKVPIFFSNSELWASVQRNGFVRDNQGKILTPVLMINRTAVTKRDDLKDLRVLESSDNRILMKRGYSAGNSYDRFGLSNAPKRPEYYSIDVPKYVQVEYELLLWADTVAQMNEIVEQLMWFDGKAFGDTYKFITNIDAPSFDISTNSGEDRTVRATLPMTTKAYILNTHGANAPSMYRVNPISKIVVGAEIEISDLSTPIDAPKTTVSMIAQPKVITYSLNSSVNKDIMIYVAISRQLTGTVIDPITVEFNSGWELAPSALPPTSVDSFMFFVNGVYVERTAIKSFTSNGVKSTLVIDSNQLGYELDVQDEVVGIGKFINQDNLA